MNGDKIHPSTQISSLKDYVDFIENQCVDYDVVLFRGQREDWSLKPKLARKNLRLQSSILEAEQDMLSYLKRKSMPHLKSIPENDWEWLSLAQHHGMATRLLDWTTNPLAALWFAINKPSDSNTDGVIWTFLLTDIEFIEDENLSSESPFTQTFTRIHQPKHITNRITSQQGWFTVHAYNSSKNQFTPLEQDMRYLNKLRKLTIPANKFQELRFHLDRCGINAYSIFADLDGLCKDAEWQFTVDIDES